MYREVRPRRSNYRPTPPARAPAKKISLLRTLMTRKEFLTAIGAIIVGFIIWRFFDHDHTILPASLTHSSSSQSATKAAPAPPVFNKQKYSLSDPTSIWLVVNKKRPLSPLKYVPASLVVPKIPLRGNITGDEQYVSSVMAPALETMVGDAAHAGVHLNLQSGYRSYNFQVSLFNSYVQQHGLAQATRESAHAGYSEHQTGFAADLGGTSNPACNVEACYASTVEGTWLAANAYKYGFIIRYPSDKEAVTGYEYEPWHVRYIGTELSTEMHNQNVETLEDFFNLGPAPTYN